MEKADRDLYAKLLELCFPGGIASSAEKAYWSLLEKDGRSGIPISMLCDAQFDKEIQSHIGHCLSYQPIHLYLNFPIGIEQNDLNLWLEQSPSVLNDFRKSMNTLSQSQLTNLRKLFQGLMEDPGEFAEDWLAYVDQVVDQLDYQGLTVQFPKLTPNSKAAQKSFCQFLISWLLLQDLCSESRKLLWKTYLQIRNRNPYIN